MRGCGHTCPTATTGDGSSFLLTLHRRQLKGLRKFGLRGTGLVPHPLSFLFCCFRFCFLILSQLAHSIFMLLYVILVYIQHIKLYTIASHVNVPIGCVSTARCFCRTLVKQDTLLGHPCHLYTSVYTMIMGFSLREREAKGRKEEGKRKKGWRECVGEDWTSEVGEAVLFAVGTLAISLTHNYIYMYILLYNSNDITFHTTLIIHVSTVYNAYILNYVLKRTTLHNVCIHSYIVCTQTHLTLNGGSQ